jgi:phosphoribosyl 1,2-cyclic phosphodiesterase
MIKITPIASGSKGNCYLIDDGQSKLLIDCGIPLSRIQKALSYQLTDIAGCLVSHCHLDHSKAVKDMMDMGTEVYMSAGSADALDIKNHRLIKIKAMQEYYIGSLKVIPFDVQHDAPEPLGFFLKSVETGESVLYFTDTFYIKYKFPGINYLMAECNYSLDSLIASVDNGYIPAAIAPRIVKSHMSIDNLLEMLKANDLSQLKQVYLLHLSDNNSDEKSFKEAVQRATGAEVYVC